MSQPASQFGPIQEHEFTVRASDLMACVVAANMKLDDWRGRASFVSGEIDGPFYGYGGYVAFVTVVTQRRLPFVVSPPIAPCPSASDAAVR